MGRWTGCWLFSALSLSLACGGDDGNAGPRDMNTGSMNDKSDAGRADASTGTTNNTSLACNPLAVATLGTCNAAQIEEIGVCLENACKTELATCYGPDHKSGKYSGACAAHGSCTSKCSCRDQSCYETCSVSDECTECARSFVACGASCAGKLGCALGDAGFNEAIAGLQRACDDLLACCNSLTVADAKRECTEAHAQVRGSGGFLCALVTPLYCF